MRWLRIHAVPMSSPFVQRFERIAPSRSGLGLESGGSDSSLAAQIRAATVRERFSLAPVDFDHRRVFHDNALFQRVYDSKPPRAIDGGLRSGAPHGNRSE